uniref:Uncharacterized protein n=1 Tax=Fagus sylvatica TaxID=28930 RepID=A0A2N9G3N7_FAGSY
MVTNTTCSRILYPVMNLPPDTKFAELIDHENGCWKQGLVQSRFQPYDASQILRIPLSPALLEDVLINLGNTRAGLFTVTSAMNMKWGAFQAEPSNSPICQVGFRCKYLVGGSCSTL